MCKLVISRWNCRAFSSQIFIQYTNVAIETSYFFFGTFFDKSVSILNEIWICMAVMTVVNLSWIHWYCNQLYWSLFLDNVIFKSVKFFQYVCYGYTQWTVSKFYKFTPVERTSAFLHCVTNAKLYTHDKIHNSDNELQFNATLILPHTVSLNSGADSLNVYCTLSVISWSI